MKLRGYLRDGEITNFYPNHKPVKIGGSQNENIRR